MASYGPWTVPGLHLQSAPAMHRPCPPTPTPCPSVLHISGRSDHGGGPEHILQVINASLGVRHHIACPDDGVYWRRYRDHLGPDRLCPLPHRSVSLRSFLRLRSFATANTIAVIHSHGTCAGAYGRILGFSLGVPVIHSFHGVPVTNSLKHSLYGLAERVLGRMTHCGVAVSAGEADLVHQRWQHYRGKLAVVPNGIDLGGARPEWTPWPAKGPLRIVSFTRRNHQKHPELLVEIARVLSLQNLDFRIDAYGEGLARSDLGTAAFRRGVAQRLHFHPPTDAPAAVLAGAHIYLSTSRWEGMPLAVLEAWRSGLVVVASDVVGNRDLVRDGRSGRLFPAGDGRAAARIIRDLANDAVAADQLRHRAARLAQIGHCRNLMALRLEWLYHHLAEGGLQEDLVARESWPTGSQPTDEASSARLRVV